MLIDDLLNCFEQFFLHSIFWKIPVLNLPISVLFIFLAAIFITIRLNFLPIRTFRHALRIAKDEYTAPEDPGTFSPKEAIYTAVLSTVGLGSVAGASVAISLGGVGALFWIVVTGFFIASLKYSEIMLGIKYRSLNPITGEIEGGPFAYIKKSLESIGLKGIAMIVVKIYAFSLLFSTFLPTNMLQASQTVLLLGDNFPILKDHNWKLVMAAIFTSIVGITIIGGVKTIVKIGSAVVPFMTISYVVSCIVIIVANYSSIGGALSIIMQKAFDIKAVEGGMAGGLTYGLIRSVYCTEAGSGTSAIAHLQAKTASGVREGFTAFIEILFPLVVCFLTGFAVVVSGAYNIPGLEGGISLTNEAFKSVADWFAYILVIQVPVLAITTIIAWGLYGTYIWKACFGKLFPDWLFKVLFLTAMFIGCVTENFGAIIRFSDYTWVTVAVVNVLVLLLMSKSVNSETELYLDRLKAGEFKNFKH